MKTFFRIMDNRRTRLSRAPLAARMNPLGLAARMSPLGLAARMSPLGLAARMSPLGGPLRPRLGALRPPLVA